MNRYVFMALLLCVPARSACQLISNASCEMGAGIRAEQPAAWL